MDTAKGMLREHGLACVVHGEVADTPRPTGFKVVVWEGSVEPALALDGDIWIDTG